MYHDLQKNGGTNFEGESGTGALRVAVYIKLCPQNLKQRLATKTKTALKQERCNLSDLKHDLHCGFVELWRIGLGLIETSTSAAPVTLNHRHSSSLSSSLLIWTPAFCWLSSVASLGPAWHGPRLRPTRSKKPGLTSPSSCGPGPGRRPPGPKSCRPRAGPEAPAGQGGLASSGWPRSWVHIRL